MVSQLILQVGRVPTLPEPDVEDWGITVIEIGSTEWAERAIDALSYEPVVVFTSSSGGPGFIDIRSSDLPSRRRPIWPQLREILKAHGFRVPRARWRR